MALSTVEKKMLDALELVMAYLTRKHIDRKEYLNLLEMVRDAVQAGRNKFFGCPSGVHRSDCTCTETTKGANVHYLKHGKRNE